MFGTKTRVYNCSSKHYLPIRVCLQLFFQTVPADPCWTLALCLFITFLTVTSHILSFFHYVINSNNTCRSVVRVCCGSVVLPNNLAATSFPLTLTCSQAAPTTIAPEPILNASIVPSYHQRSYRPVRNHSRLQISLNSPPLIRYMCYLDPASVSSLPLHIFNPRPIHSPPIPHPSTLQLLYPQQHLQGTAQFTILESYKCIPLRISTHTVKSSLLDTTGTITSFNQPTTTTPLSRFLP